MYITYIFLFVAVLLPQKLLKVPAIYC